MKNEQTVFQYQVKHYDYFTFKKSVPNIKSWNFNLILKAKSENHIEVHYSKVLTDCLYLLNGFRAENIKFSVDNLPFFTYRIVEKKIEILEKENVLKHLRLLLFNLSTMENFDNDKKLKELYEELLFITEDETMLERELLRELNFIHEFDDNNFELNKIFIRHPNTTDDVNIEGLDEDERQFLNSINWSEYADYSVLKTFLSNKTTKGYDRLSGQSVISSRLSKTANLNKIMNKFIESDLDINDYDHVTLNKDRREFSRKEMKLINMCKERLTKTELIHKITKLEISLVN